MPLREGASNETRQKNIEEMISAGHDPDQAVAAAYRQQRESRKKKKKAQDAEPTRVALSDTALVDGVRRTSDGYLAASARVARVGVQKYRGAEVGMVDKDFVVLYRPAEEVFNRAAMHSMANKPVTLTHPRTMVDAKSWGKVAKGFSGSDVVRDGEFVRVPLLLTDAAAIDAYESGVRELSVGYLTDLDWTPGTTPDGEAYDGVQRDIRANHHALVPVARGGRNLTFGDGDEAMDDEIDDAWSEEAREAAAESRKAKARGHLYISQLPQSSAYGAQSGMHQVWERVKGGERAVGKPHATREEAEAHIAKLRGATDAAMDEDWDDLYDREFSEEERGKLAESGAAMKHGGFPIKSKGDLANAIHAIGRAKNRAATIRHIVKRARALGATEMLPEGWGSSSDAADHGVEDAWSDEARAAALEARREIARGLARVTEQREATARQFPVGTHVRENRQGAPKHRVIGHSGNMVHTTGGDFHVTKVVRANDAASDGGEGEETMVTIMVGGLPVRVEDGDSAKILERFIADQAENFKGKKAKPFDKGNGNGDDDDEDDDGDGDAVAKEQAREKKERGYKDAISAKDGEIAMLKKQLKDSKLDEAAQEAILREREQVKDSARKVLGDGFEFGTKTLSEIRRAAVAQAMGGASAIQDWDDAQVSGAFRLATATAPKPSGAQRMADGLSSAMRSSEGMVRGGRQLTDADVAYDEYCKRIANDYKNPAQAGAARN